MSGNVCNIYDKPSRWHSKKPKNNAYSSTLHHSLAVPLSAPASGAPAVFCPAVVLPPELSPLSVGKMGSLVFSAVPGVGVGAGALVSLPVSCWGLVVADERGRGEEPEVDVEAEADSPEVGAEAEAEAEGEVAKAALTSSLNSSRMRSLFFILRLIVRVLPLSACAVEREQIDRQMFSPLVRFSRQDTQCGLPDRLTELHDEGRVLYALRSVLLYLQGRVGVHQAGHIILEELAAGALEPHRQTCRARRVSTTVRRRPLDRQATTSPVSWGRRRKTRRDDAPRAIVLVAHCECQLERAQPRRQGDARWPVPQALELLRERGDLLRDAAGCGGGHRRREGRGGCGGGC